MAKTIAAIIAAEKRSRPVARKSRKKPDLEWHPFKKEQAQLDRAMKLAQRGLEKRA